MSTILPDPSITATSTGAGDPAIDVKEPEVKKDAEWVKERLALLYDYYDQYLNVLTSFNASGISSSMAFLGSPKDKQRVIDSYLKVLNAKFEQSINRDKYINELFTEMGKSSTDGKIYPNFRVNDLRLGFYKKIKIADTFSELSEATIKEKRSKLQRDFAVYLQNYAKVISGSRSVAPGYSFTDKENINTSSGTPAIQDFISKNFAGGKDFKDYIPDSEKKAGKTKAQTALEGEVAEPSIIDLLKGAKTENELSISIEELKALINKGIVSIEAAKKIIENRLDDLNSYPAEVRPKFESMFKDFINEPEGPIPGGPIPGGPIPEEEEEEKKVEDEVSQEEIDYALEEIKRVLAPLSEWNEKVRAVDDPTSWDEEMKRKVLNDKGITLNTVVKEEESLGRDVLYPLSYKFKAVDVTRFLDDFFRRAKDGGDEFLFPEFDFTFGTGVEEEKGEEKGGGEEEMPAVPGFEIKPMEMSMMPLPSKGEALLVKMETKASLLELTDEKLDELYKTFFGEIPEGMERDAMAMALAVRMSGETARVEIPNFKSLKLSDWTLDGLTKYLEGLKALPEDQGRLKAVYDKTGMYGFAKTDPFKYETSDAFAMNDEQWVKMGTIEPLRPSNEMMKQKKAELKPQEWVKKHLPLKSEEQLDEGFSAVNKKLSAGSKIATKAFLELDPDISNHEVYQSSGFADDFNESYDAAWSADSWSRVGYTQEEAHWEIPEIASKASKTISDMMAEQMIGSLNYSSVRKGDIPDWYDTW